MEDLRLASGCQADVPDREVFDRMLLFGRIGPEMLWMLIQIFKIFHANIVNMDTHNMSFKFNKKSSDESLKMAIDSIDGSCDHSLGMQGVQMRDPVACSAALCPARFELPPFESHVVWINKQN